MNDCDCDYDSDSERLLQYSDTVRIDCGSEKRSAMLNCFAQSRCLDRIDDRSDRWITLTMTLTLTLVRWDDDCLRTSMMCD